MSKHLATVERKKSLNMMRPPTEPGSAIYLNQLRGEETEKGKKSPTDNKKPLCSF